MDERKYARTAVRRAFTRHITTLRQCLDNVPKEMDDIVANFQLLEEKAMELEQLDKKIFEDMIIAESAEAEITSELENVDSYRLKFLKLKIEVATVTCPPKPAIQSPNGSLNLGLAPTVGNQDVRRSMKLPKIKLKKFGGDVKDWLPFWSQFRKIHDDSTIEIEDKFQYLSQAMVSGSRASELVESFLPTSANYDKAIKGLKYRFGRDELLVEVYVRELLELVLHNAIKAEEKPALSKFYDKLESHLRALESLGVTSDKCATLLYPLVESSLPEDFLRVWQRQRVFSESDGSGDRLSSLMKFLQSEVESEQRIAIAVGGFGVSSVKQNIREEKGKFKKKDRSQPAENIPTAMGLATLRDAKTVSCIFCAEGHDSAQCYQARKLTLNERQKLVKDKNACFKCLKVGHSAFKCRSNLQCSWCSKKHVLIMCRDMQQGNQDSVNAAYEDKKDIPKSSNAATLLRNPKVFLQTARVKLCNGNKQCVVRVALDSCSHRSYILDSAVNRVGYKPIGQQEMIHMVFGGTKTAPETHKGYLIKIRDMEEQYEFSFEALSRNQIVGGIPSVSNGPWLEELRGRGIMLSDVGHTEEPISILIGADVFGKLQTGKLIDLKSGPTAIETKLCWMLIGKRAQEYEEHVDSTLVVTTMFTREADVSELWRLDSLGITDPAETKTKDQLSQEVVDRFRQTVTTHEDGRFEVDLPWREGHPPLSDNRELAVGRLVSMTKKLRAQGHNEGYDQVFDEWLQEGIIEPVSKEELEDISFYLPHRPVIKEDSTTKIRPVFDASATGKNALSLNKCLDVGPNLIELIPTILLRFRENEMAIVADIKKAFLQISVHEKDRNVLRFLWWNKSDPRKIKVYRYTRVVFGVSSSPFLLGATVQLHLEKCCEAEKDDDRKQLIKRLQSSFYVDNCATSVNTEKQREEFREVSTEIMAKGCFELRGWEFTGDQSEKRQTGVLGLAWNKDSDTLSLREVKVSELISENVTKRDILSICHKVFDPIGFACPVLLCPKLLLQTVWNEKCEWDQPVTAVVAKQFVEWANKLPALTDLQIPRKLIGSIADKKSLTFHVFVDASEAAYATAIFSRLETPTGVQVSLVQAKSRVTPTSKTKAITIPRLELLAALVGARLAKFVRDALQLEGVDFYYWSDSTTALAWIKRVCSWAPFVMNRVREVRALTEVQRWRHVPGSKNPADLPSRGCTVEKLIESKWWEGPVWLRSLKEQWPSEDLIEDDEEINKELKRSQEKIQHAEYPIVNTVTAETLSEKKTSDLFLRYFSQYTKIVRLIAWMFRIFYNKKCNQQQIIRGNLSLTEFSGAEEWIFRIVQQESFDGVNDKRLVNLSPFLDEHNIIRLKTLISNRQDTKDFCYPIVLDPKDLMVTRLIEYQHRVSHHAGSQIVLNQLRERFWILTGRRAVRAVTGRCGVCKRFSAKHMVAEPAALPENRVKDAKAFEVTGVDYAGPVFLRKGQKAWICLFTCAVYRAVHLEVVTSLSTVGFLEALRRFIARRGRPNIVYSDNGTNFEGANNLLRRIDWNKIQDYGSIRRIEWKFNPPTAAWWGGWWERMVRIIKDLLRKILGKACLTYEEFNTVLCDCEAVINSRPITYVSNDINELSPITPMNFLQENEQTGVLDLDRINKTDLRERIVYLQKLQEDLRKRFRIEYLGQLKREGQFKGTSQKIGVGDVVLIGSDNKKRIDWPLAKVINVFPGKDQQVRVVKLKTMNGELVRPVQRIYLLETADSVPPDNIVRAISKNIQPVKKDNGQIRDLNQNNENDVRVQTRSGRIVKPPQRLQL